MRHGDKQNNLGRTKSHRDALLRNLASELIMHKRIVTTQAKARSLRTYVEPLITKTKNNETETQIMHQHRVVFSYLNDKSAVKELFTVIAPKVASRPGGYTRIIKLGKRVGDNAELALIELVDFNEVYGKGVEKAGEPAKRTRRGGKRKTEAVAAVTSTAAEVVEETTSEVTTPEANIAEEGKEKTAE